MELLITIIVLSLIFSGLILSQVSARNSNRQTRLARQRIRKNRPLFQKRRNIDKGWDDYNYDDDYYKK